MEVWNSRKNERTRLFKREVPRSEGHRRFVSARHRISAWLLWNMKEKALCDFVDVGLMPKPQGGCIPQTEGAISFMCKCITPMFIADFITFITIMFLKIRRKKLECSRLCRRTFASKSYFYSFSCSGRNSP